MLPSINLSELRERSSNLADWWVNKERERNEWRKREGKSWMNETEWNEWRSPAASLFRNEWSGAPSSPAARQVHQLNFFSFLHKRRKEVRVEWKSFLVFSSANWIYEICGLWAGGPSAASELHSAVILFLLHFISLALLLLNWKEKTSCGSELSEGSGVD